MFLRALGELPSCWLQCSFSVPLLFHKSGHCCPWPTATGLFLEYYGVDTPRPLPGEHEPKQEGTLTSSCIQKVLERKGMSLSQDHLGSFSCGSGVLVFPGNLHLRVGPNCSLSLAMDWARKPDALGSCTDSGGQAPFGWCSALC